MERKGQNSARPVTDRRASPTMQGVGLWSAIFVLSLATFVSILDTTIVNVAIPHIAGAFAASPNEGTWAITSYAVAEAFTVPLSGWLAARFGVVRMFLFAIIGFTLFSALCGMATSLQMLVVFRVLQGLAGGPLMPMAQTLILRIAPPKQVEMAMGLWMMTTILAPIAGPILGGMLADGIGWRWAFYINIPVCVICGLWAWRLLRTRETQILRQPIDYIGMILLAVWVGALQIMLDNGEDHDWFASPWIIGLFAASAIGFVLFVIWEMTDSHPVVDLRVFRHRDLRGLRRGADPHLRRLLRLDHPPAALAADQHGLHRDLVGLHPVLPGHPGHRGGAVRGDGDVQDRSPADDVGWAWRSWRRRSSPAPVSRSISASTR